MTLLRAERTELASPAVSVSRREVSAGAGTFPAETLPTKALTEEHLQERKSGRTRRLAHHWQHMKTQGGYLDYMQYYFGDSDNGEILGILEHCHTSWHRERKGEDIRYRAAGCGRRFDCPLCGNYVQSQLASDSFKNMSLALTGLDVAGVEYSHSGLKLVFTIPKETSAWIDELLFNNRDEWIKEVNRLRKAVAELVKEWFGAGIGYETTLELTGESNPVDPHYHVSVYVFPARYVNGGWEAIPGWTDKLDEWRADWTATVNSLYNLKLENADFRYNYLETEGQMRHWLRYQYRPILADLWRGWHYYDGLGLEYRFKKDYKVNEVYILREDLGKAFDRAKELPKHFKRIRWGGIFADGVRGKTMGLVLGLERVEKEDPDTSEAEGWTRDAGVWFRLIRYESDGIILKDIDTDEEVKLPDNFVDYRPDMVRTGRRVRWQEPGGGRGGGENLVLHRKGGLTNSACSCQEVNHG